METIVGKFCDMMALRAELDLPMFCENYLHKYQNKYNVVISPERMLILMGSGIDYRQFFEEHKDWYSTFLKAQDLFHDHLQEKFIEWSFPISRNTRMFFSDWSHCMAHVVVSYLRNNQHSKM